MTNLCGWGIKSSWCIKVHGVINPQFCYIKKMTQFSRIKLLALFMLFGFVALISTAQDLKKDLENADEFSAIPPASSLLYLSLPRSEKDPLLVVMPEGPPLSSQRDMEDFKKKKAPGPKDQLNACDSIIYAGIEASRNQSFEPLEDFMTQAIRQDCDDGMASFYLGALYEGQGKWKDALSPLHLAQENLIENWPNHRFVKFVHAYLGRCYFRLKRYQPAILHLSLVLNDYPDDLPHNFFAGVSYHRLGHSEKGIEHLRKVIQLAQVIPRSKAIAQESYHALGLIYLDQGEFLLARNVLLEGLSRFPSNNQLRQTLSQVEQSFKQQQQNKRKGLFRGLF